jgi:TP901 family phage tail tape measure protein
VTEDLRVIVDADASPLKRELAGAGGSIRGFGREVAGQTRGAAAFNAALNKQKESLRGVGTFARTAGFAVGGALVVGIASAIKTGAEFESQMARVQAVTGATGEEMDQLRGMAIKLGADTKFSANEAAEAMYELSSAGFDVQETQKALPGTLSLAAASSVDLATAAEISSNALRGFGLQSEESTHVSDVLAQSVNSSSVEMEDLQLSLKYIGPIARATGMDFEEMISAVSLMGDAGIKGEQAGTSLRGGLLRLVKPTKQVKEGLKEVGLTAEEMQGPKGLRSLPEIVAELQEGMEGLSRSEQAHALASIFGTEALSGMLTVVEAGPAKLARLTKEFEHSDGASAKAAKTMNDTVKGSFEQLKGSFETVEIELYENFSEPLKAALLDATDFVNEQGKHLQKALDEAMATPEFKQGDIGQKAEILAEAVGQVWKDSGLKDDITEGLVEAFNFALPRIAEAAGHSAVTAAETFATGFLKSDALGKLVIGAWLFTKLGGFAALRAAGAKAGTQVSVGMTEAIAAQGAMPATTVIADGRGNRSRSARGPAPRVQRGAIPAPVVTPEVDVPSGKSKGIEWGKSFLKGFGISMVAGGGIAGLIAPADGVSAHLQNAASAATFGIIPEAGPSMGEQLAVSVAESFDQHFGPNLAKGLQRNGVRDLQGVANDLRGMIQIGIEEGSSEASLEPLRQRLQAVTQTVDLRLDIKENEEDLRSGVVKRMADIKQLVARNSVEIGEAWSAGSDEWRVATARNMQAAISAIRAGMQSGVIETKAGQDEIAHLLREKKLVQGEDPFQIAAGFADGWRKAGQVNRGQIAQIKSDLAKMPKDAREAAQNAMVGMARTMEAKGKLVKGSADRLNSALATRFGATSRQVEMSTASAMANVAKSASEGATDTGAALANIFDNLSNALAAAGSSKIPHFSLTVLSAASQYHHTREQTQNGIGGTPKAEGGFFVNSSDRRDHVHAVLGGREAVLTVHDQPEVQAGLAVGKALGVTRNGSLGEMFSGPRRPNYFAKGGFTGPAAKLSHPQIHGPELIGALSQAAIDQTHAAAAKYLQEHMKAVSGGDIVEVGHSLQGLGYEVSEHPAFGGVHPVHTAGSDHNSGHAIDVNDDAAPRGHGSSEMSSLDWLAPQLLKLPHRQVIWRNHDLDTGAPIPAHMDHLHFAMAIGGFVETLLKGMAEGGFAGDGYTVKGIAASAQQMHTAGEIQKAGDTTGANHLARVASMMAATQESNMGSTGNTFQLTGDFEGVSPSDNAYTQAVQWFGKGYYEGGGIGLSHKMSDPGDIAQAVEGSAYPDAYDPWKAEGQKWTDGWRGDGSGAADVPDEKVPGTYSGARTGSLSFPSTPDNLKGVEKVITQWQKEAGLYRRAIKKAADKGKPKVEGALRKNLTDIENFLRQLYDARHKLRFEKAKKRFNAKLGRQLSSLVGFEQSIEDRQKDYERADQFASQVVGTEPQAPILPPTATDEERSAAEKAYIDQFKSYVEGNERGAYENVLATEANWRNTIISAERKATGLEMGWERGARSARVEMGSINRYTDETGDVIEKTRRDINTWQSNHPKKGPADYPDWLKQEIKKRDLMVEMRDRMRAKLPMLRERNRGFTDTIAQGRERFYGGVPWLGEANNIQPPGQPAFPGTMSPLRPPDPPPAGSGTFEDSLVSVQGIHWPDQHAFIDALPSMPEAGKFGGAIWETQTAIRELGLKISQAETSLDTDEAGDSNSAWTAAKEALALQDKQNLQLSQGETRVFGDFFRELGVGVPFLGAYMQGTGGLRIGRSGMAMLHRDEQVVPDPKGPAGSQFSIGSAAPAGPPQVTLVLRDKAGALVELVDARVDGKIAKVDQQLGAAGRRRAFAPGR